MSATFAAWLDSIQCTAPFTDKDAAALYGMIHDAFAGSARRAIVDVYTTSGDKVFIRVVTPNDVVLERTIDVV